MSNSSLLSTGAKIGVLALRNRVAMAPLTRGRAVDGGVANELMATYYSQRASAGLIISEGTFISEAAKGWVGAPGIFTDEMSAGWKTSVDAVHAKGALFFAQLWHCGRASHSTFRKDLSLAVAPSAIAINADYIHSPTGKHAHEVPRAMNADDIKQTLQDYKNAAEKAKAAGFDGVEIHSANGYLLDSFLQTKTNQRTDDYGGSLENRFRLLREVIEVVTQVLPSDRVGVRLSPNGVYNDMGSPDYKEAFTYYLEELNKLSLGYVHVMDGLGFGFHQLGEPFTLEHVRQSYKGTVIANCGHTTEDGERFIDQGLADIVAFGRPFISNPDLVDRIANKWPIDQQGQTPTFWYTPGPEGYTDYPTYPESQAAQ